jgi:DNA modification methylase
VTTTKKPLAIIYNGDCIEVLASLKPNSVDAIVTDPPYGLSKTPDILEVLRHWIAGDDYKHRGGGFMGKSWDSFVPGPTVWREAYRVLKPGGHLLAFAGSRTFDLMGISIRMAGFEIGDGLSWLYGSGFPKSMDVSKAIDKRLGTSDGRKVVGVKSGHEDFVGNESAVTSLRDSTMGGEGGFARPWMDDPDKVAAYRMKTSAGSPEAQNWEGWGTALKPAWEPIILARKPRVGTVANNVLTYGTGALNIDATRIGTSESLNGGAYSGDKRQRDERTSTDSEPGAVPLSRLNRGVGEYTQPSGRWPANVLLGHHEDCEHLGTKRIKAIKGGDSQQIDVGSGRYNWNTGRRDVKPDGIDPGYGDADGMETVDAWECVEDCPVRLLDQQTGVLTSGKPAGGKGPHRAKASVGKGGGAVLEGSADGSLRKAGVEYHRYGDKGGASRFFYNAKASKSERNRGLPEGMKNSHPTVKPIALMAYLCKLITPPGGVVLDPYVGSGTTGVAAVQEGFHFIGAEIDTENDYVEIARHRITHAGGEVEVVEVPPTQKDADSATV